MDPTPIGAATAATGSRASETHLQTFSEYRRVLEQLGRGMAAEAEGALGLVMLFREDLAVEIERRRRIAAAGDHAAATDSSQGAAQIVVMIARLVAVITTMSVAGRQLWGDAIGVHRILDEAFAVKKSKQLSEA
jgi:hypothetical protein